jgi:hypothetical protein
VFGYHHPNSADWVLTNGPQKDPEQNVRIRALFNIVKREIAHHTQKTFAIASTTVLQAKTGLKLKWSENFTDLNNWDKKWMFWNKLGLQNIHVLPTYENPSDMHIEVSITQGSSTPKITAAAGIPIGGK